MKRGTRSLNEQREDYENALLRRHIDSYMDAVRIIAGEMLNQPGMKRTYMHEILKTGQDAIVHALMTFDKNKHYDLDRHVYGNIRQAFQKLASQA